MEYKETLMKNNRIKRLLSGKSTIVLDVMALNQSIKRLVISL